MYNVQLSKTTFVVKPVPVAPAASILKKSRTPVKAYEAQLLNVLDFTLTAKTLVFLKSIKSPPLLVEI